MSNAKSKQAKPKTGLARCMELASDRKGLVFLAAVHPVHSGLFYDPLNYRCFSEP